VIAEAKDAELCRNIPHSQAALRPVWDDPSKDPDLEGFSPLIKAELLRLSGFFLSFCGKSRNIPEYHARAKDFLSRSVRIFEEEGFADKAAEANVMLALAYWYDGEVQECEAILEMVENEFAGNQLHPVYLQIRVNRIMTLYWKRSAESIQQAVSIIQQLTVPMEFCKDLRLMAMFHNQAGLVYELTGQLDKAIYHMAEAIRKARAANNSLFVGFNLNNLAVILLRRRHYDEAYRRACEAEETFERLGGVGWIAQVLDTKAMIKLAMGAPHEALEYTDRSIALLRDSRDSASLCDSLWSRCMCLFRLGQVAEGLAQYLDLQRIAAEQIGSSACTKYESAFASLIYVRRGVPFHEEVDYFKRMLIKEAMVTANGSVTEAARELGMKNHQALSQILATQFPEIPEELGIKRRARRSDRKRAKSRTAQRPIVRDISRIRLQNCRWTFADDVAGEFSTDQIELFFVSKRIMMSFGIDRDSLVAVATPKEWKPGLWVVYNHENEFYAGKLQRDEFSQLLNIPVPGSAMPLLLDEVALVGVPVGHCDFADTEREHIRFESF